jgi:hypothetical protein
LEREKVKLAAQQTAKHSNNEYEVEGILGKRTKKGKDGTVKVKYLIRWKGWGEEGNDSYYYIICKNNFPFQVTLGKQKIL